MGCCFSTSASPRFPDITSAQGVFPDSSPPEGYESVTFMPQTGMFATSLGVFLQGDTDVPTYHFAPSGSTYKLFKVEAASNAGPIISDQDGPKKVEVAKIKQGWQSSKSQGTHSTDFDNEHQYSKTMSATKKLTVVSNINSVEMDVTVKKIFKRNEGTKTSISDDFNFVGDEGSGERGELQKHGETLAIMFDPMPKGMSEEISPVVGAAAMMEFLQRPCGMYLKSYLSEDEKIQIIALMATSSDRLIRTAMLDITNGSHSNFNTHPTYVDGNSASYGGPSYDGGDDMGGGDGGDMGGGDGGDGGGNED
jgi:hypothetical protein